MGLLSEEGIENSLNKLHYEWGVMAGTVLNRVYKFRNFKDALNFVDKVGALAEELNHHPRICLEWGKVEIEITTHNENGLTDKDFELAGKIDKIK